MIYDIIMINMIIIKWSRREDSRNLFKYYFFTPCDPIVLFSLYRNNIIDSATGKYILPRTHELFGCCWKIPVECASHSSQAKEAHHLVSKYHCTPCTAAFVHCAFEIYFGEGVGRNPKQLITFTLLLYTFCHL